MVAVRHATGQMAQTIFADPDDYGGVLANPPDELVRFGVRYPGGTIATTIDPVGGSPAGGEAQQRSRTGPFIVLRFDGAAGYDQHSEGWYELLMWPLPPATTIELVTEWPARGVPLTRVELDGAMIHDAVARAKPLWPA